MRHAMIEQATPEEIRIAEWCADWLLDSVACATQDRSLLRGERDYNADMGDALLANGMIAALHAISKAKETT